VLEALGVPPVHGVGGLRLSLGHSNRADHVTYLLERLPLIVEQIKGAAPVQL
jgi:cysteine sulfinate desulfinase/cysteine desulfurase-like protein